MSEATVFLCGGPGPWMVAPVVHCPWCDEKRRRLEALVFDGWCGSDFICGTCGYRWSSDDEGWRKVSEEDRDKNIAKVAATADPNCWECHDRGVITSPIDEPRPCTCVAAPASSERAPEGMEE